MAAGKCWNCGRAYGKSAEFCKKCGKPVHEERAAISSGPAVEAAGEGATCDSTADINGACSAAEAGASVNPGVYPADERALECALSELDGPSYPPEVPKAPVTPHEPARIHADAPAYRLQVQNGSDSGKWIEISDRGSLVVGSQHDADFVIRGDDTLSRRHALFALRDGTLYVQDGGSSNGTGIVQWVTGPTPVADGSVLLLGGTRVRISKER